MTLTLKRRCDCGIKVDLPNGKLRDIPHKFKNIEIIGK